MGLRPAFAAASSSLAQAFGRPGGGPAAPLGLSADEDPGGQRGRGGRTCGELADQFSATTASWCSPATSWNCFACSTSRVIGCPARARVAPPRTERAAPDPRSMKASSEGVAELGRGFPRRSDSMRARPRARLRRRPRAGRLAPLRGCEEPEIALAAKGGEHALLGALARFRASSGRTSGPSRSRGVRVVTSAREVIEHERRGPVPARARRRARRLLAKPLDPALIERGRGGLQNRTQPACGDAELVGDPSATIRAGPRGRARGAARTRGRSRGQLQLGSGRRRLDYGLGADYAREPLLQFSRVAPRPCADLLDPRPVSRSAASELDLDLLDLAGRRAGRRGARSTTRPPWPASAGPAGRGSRRPGRVGVRPGPSLNPPDAAETELLPSADGAAGPPAAPGQG